MNILNLSFNNDISVLTCGIDNGFIIYKLFTNKIEKLIKTQTGGGVGIARILKRSNLVLLVGGGEKPFIKNTVLSIWDIKNKVYRLEIDKKEEIKNVYLVGDEDDVTNIIIVLKNKICNFNGSSILINSQNTYDNNDGLCVLNDNIIVTLGLKIGEIAIWDIVNNKYYTIQAHKKDISAIAINKRGTMVASSSKTGTNIHVYDVKTRTKINEFKRGTLGANIYSICFNNKSTRLACCGNTPTLHIFDLNSDIKTTKNIGSKFKSIIPKSMRPKYLNSQWSFIQIKIDNKGNKTICSFDENDCLHIVTYNGIYYKISGPNYCKIKSYNLYTENID